MHEVVIIGSGPAGLTAAVYTARANLAPLVLEGEPSSTSDQPGGQLMLTTDVENYPGFPDGVLGPDLMSRIREQAARFGADLRMEKVSRGRPFTDTRSASGWATPTPASRRSGPRAVIVATGAQSLMLGLPGEQALIGHGVSTCATCDGFFFRDQDIAVVGGGDSALEEAHLPHEVRPLGHDRAPPRDAACLEDHAGPGLRQREDRASAGTRSSRASRATAASSRSCCATSTPTRLDELVVTGLFVAIGHRPSTSLFSGMLDMDEAGYLRTEPGSTRTNIPGVFACGDVQDSTYRQAVTAAGSGCMAAIDAERWLEHLGHAPAEPRPG